MKKLETVIENILEKYEKARNNDATLIAHIINKECHEFVRKDKDGKEIIRLKDLQHIYNKTNFYNIVRTRQMIQSSEGKEPRWLSTDEKVRKARKINEEVWRNYCHSMKPVAEPNQYKG